MNNKRGGESVNLEESDNDLYTRSYKVGLRAM